MAASEPNFFNAHLWPIPTSVSARPPLSPSFTGEKENGERHAHPVDRRSPPPGSLRDNRKRKRAQGEEGTGPGVRACLKEEVDPSAAPSPPSLRLRLQGDPEEIEHPGEPMPDLSPRFGEPQQPHTPPLMAPPGLVGDEGLLTPDRQAFHAARNAEAEGKVHFEWDCWICNTVQPDCVLFVANNPECGMCRGVRERCS